MPKRQNDNSDVSDEDIVDSDDNDKHADTKPKKKSSKLEAEVQHGLKHFNSFLEDMFGKQLTNIEFSEILVSSDRFISPPSLMRDYNKDPAAYLTACVPEWRSLISQPTKKNGSPYMLIICSSAIRSCNLNRLLTPFKGSNCKVGKLFSRHMKIENQKKFLEKSVVHLGMGTPARICQLVTDGSLSLSSLRWVVFDWNFRDAKRSRMIDNSDERRDLTPLLLNVLLSKSFIKNADVPKFSFVLL